MEYLIGATVAVVVIVLVGAYLLFKNGPMIK
jgi:hypothetical protein